ncbi:MAG: D-2-hydroxyacid dehydrogenase [Oscillospiraceae bacterium]|nr:D-2-hydroxyacid dehydrogenase [Oscillospiraceae bacterium]
MKIVILDGFAANPGDLSWEGLDRFGEVVNYDRTRPDEVLERSAGADVLLTNKTVLDRKIIESLPDLKMIGVLATGYNIVDIEAAREKGIPVCNVPAYSTDSVAQLVFAFILEQASRVAEHTASVKAGDWANSRDFSYMVAPITELAGKTMGFVGFGNVAKKTADIAAAFGMQVIAYSRTMKGQEDRKNFRWVSLDELCEQADYISLNCPLTEQTKGLVNREFLSKMKPSAMLINTARGPVVVEEDLAEALDKGVIAAAAVDVLSSEPPKGDNPLLTAKNIWITPHIGWATKEARVRLLKVTEENLEAFAKGEPQNVVNG